MRVALLLLGVLTLGAIYFVLLDRGERTAPPSQVAPDEPSPAPVAAVPTNPALPDSPPPPVEKESAPPAEPLERLLRKVRLCTDRLERFRDLESLLREHGSSAEVRVLLLELFSDADLIFRQSAIHALQPLLLTDPRALRAVVAAAKDPDAKVRVSAVSALGGVSGENPQAAAVILAALDDENEEVRSNAMVFLGNLGEPGARRALDLLIAGGMSEDSRDDLAMHVVEFGLLPQALDHKPDADTVAALLIHLLTDSWDHPEFARAIRGRFADLMPTFRPDHNYGWREFFHVADDAGDGFLILDAALNRSQPDAVRVGAVAATMRQEDKGRRFFNLTRQILDEHGTTAKLRLGLVENLDTMRVEHPEHRRRVKAVLQEIARTDAAEAVRKAAKEAAR